MKVFTFFDKNDADRKLANYIIQSIEDNFSLQDSIIIGVSGGSTPFSMYQLLAPMLVEQLTTGKLKEVVVVQIDERYVPSNSDRSNQKQLRQIFKDPIKFFGMYGPDTVVPLSEAVLRTNMDYTEILEFRNKSGMDIALLGMGQDGHTASLFPNNSEYIYQLNFDELQKQERIVIGMHVEVQQEDRISLTSHFINKTSLKLLYATGNEKLATLRDAIKSNIREKYPILSVLDNLILFTEKSQVVDEFNFL